MSNTEDQESQGKNRRRRKRKHQQESQDDQRQKSQEPSDQQEELEQVEQKDWDYITKQVVNRNLPPFLKKLFPGLDFEYMEPLPVELKSEKFELDCPCVIKVKGQERVALVEVQTRNDRSMGERLLLYILLVRLIYRERFGSDLIVMPGVINLLDDGNLPEQPYRIPVGDGEFITIPYKTIYLGKMEASEFLETFPVDWLPFLPFTRGGRDQEIMRPIIKKLEKQSDDLLYKAAVEIESYVLEQYNEDQSWLLEMVAKSMYQREDLPIYQGLKKLIMEKGLQKG